MGFWNSARRGRRAGGWSLAAAGLLALAACSNSEIASFDPLAALLAPLATAPATTPAASAVGPGSTGPSATAPRAATPIATLPAIGKLGDLTAAQLVARIGEPDFRRVELPGELWQYRSTSCVLDVFLYGDDGAAARVVHAEARSRNPGGRVNCGDGVDALRGHLREGQS